MTTENDTIPINCTGLFIPSLVIQNQPNTTISALRTFYDLLDPNAANNIWDRLEEVIDGGSSVLSFIKVFDWDIFHATEDEKTMQHLSMDYTERQKQNISFVYGGVVFDSLKDENLTTVPPKVRIRLRLNRTFVHDTTRMRTKLVRICAICMYSVVYFFSYSICTYIVYSVCVTLYELFI